MKSVLVINGSPRGESSGSYLVARHFAEGYAKESGAAVRTIHLAHDRIAPCTGCYACWRATPGICVQKDAMSGELLKSYADADLVVLATPIYHYGMGALLKAFFERTLPMNYPYMVRKEGLYVHPRRYTLNPDRKFVAFATAGFPDEDNFRPLSVHLKKLLGASLVGEFHIPEGELYRQKELRHLTEPRLALVRADGEAMAKTGTLPEGAASATAPLVDKDGFAALANESWEVPGERRPTEEEVAGTVPYLGSGYSAAADGAQTGAGRTYLTRMAAAFDPVAGKAIAMEIGFAFEDTGERLALKIADGRCRVAETGNGAPPEVLVRTSLETWKRIGSGEIDGQTALMQGSYRIEGNFGLFMKVNGLFGGGSAKPQEETAPAAARKNLMALAFVPWYFGMWFGGSSIWLGQIVPLILGVAFLTWRERRGEATWFERGSVFAFAFLALTAGLDPAFFATRWSAFTNLAIAAVWGSSLLYHRPLTADYSKAGYPEAVVRGPIFVHVNALLTGLWAALFAVEALIGFLPIGVSQGTIAIASAAVLIPAGIFTAWFPKWYPGHLARRGGRK